MPAMLQVCLLAICAACTLAIDRDPVYLLTPDPPMNASANDEEQNAIYSRFSFSDEEYYEWEGFDGWFNNPAHPDWGGAGNISLAKDSLVIIPVVCCCRHAFGEADLGGLPRWCV